jgi:hypothetical protein
MQAGSYDLRWYSAAEGGNVMQLSGTNGSLTVLKAANFSAGATVTGTATATQVVARGAGAGGTVRAAPQTNGGESSIGFYRNSDQSGTAAGDQWVLGQGSWSVGAGNFSIGTLSWGSCLTINTTTAAVNIPYALTIVDRQVAPVPWVAGHFDGTTSASVTLTSDTGQRDISSVSRTSVGVYVVSWTGAHPRGDLYQVFANMNATAGFLSWDRTSTSLTLRAFTNTAMPQDPAEIDFMIP